MITNTIEIHFSFYLFSTAPDMQFAEPLLHYHVRVALTVMCRILFIQLCVPAPVDHLSDISCEDRFNKRLGYFEGSRNLCMDACTDACCFPSVYLLSPSCIPSDSLWLPCFSVWTQNTQSSSCFEYREKSITVTGFALS